jgi:hypothetical protein
LSKREYALLPADDHQDFHAWLEENGISLEEAVR